MTEDLPSARTPKPLFHLETKPAISALYSIVQTMSWQGSDGLNEQTPAHSPQTSSIPRKRAKSGVGGSEEDDDNDRPRGRNQPVKRACNECRQQKVGQKTRQRVHKQERMLIRIVSCDATSSRNPNCSHVVAASSTICTALSTLALRGRRRGSSMRNSRSNYRLYGQRMRNSGLAYPEVYHQPGLHRILLQTDKALTFLDQMKRLLQDRYSISRRGTTGRVLWWEEQESRH